MSIHFTKMHGLGNDFMVVDAIRQNIQLTPAQIRELGRRDTGVGFDQCLLIESSNNPEFDFFYRIFNANGQEVGQCGNGARCLALFAYHYGLTQKKKITVATFSTAMELLINEDKTVTVNLGRPKLEPAEIPLLADEVAERYSLSLENEHCSFHAISVGNPHAVILVEDLNAAPVAILGREISEHSRFPEQTNVGFMQIIDKGNIALRVYERSCGETQACGSGAVAAAAIGRLFYQLHEQVNVNLPGGQLVVEWPNTAGSIYLRGPATLVYEGTLF